jgi:glutaredoxin-like protein
MEKEMTQLLNEDIIKQVREVFDGMQQPVQILFFGQKEKCDYCADTHQLLEELVAISDKIGLSVYDMEEDADVAKNFNVDKTPGIVIAAKNDEKIMDFGIRYAGIPSGHEFTSIIQDVMLVSGRDSGLNDRTRSFLKDLKDPIHMQVFVTPT